MNHQALHTRRVPWTAVIAFVAVSFALAWLVALPLWLGDGLAEPISVLLLPVVMFTPAVAALVVTFVMKVPGPGRRARFLGLWPLRPAKRVVWLCPEAEGRWGSGDSAMLQYRPYCTSMSHCATAADLERTLDEALEAYH